MERLQELAARFEQYLSKTFPDFQRLSLTNLSALADLRDKIEKNRPIIVSQLVDDGSSESIVLVGECTVDSSTNKLVQCMESCKASVVYRQKVIESNLKSYTKFHGLYESMLQQLTDFNMKAERVFKSESARTIDPKSILPNMFTVIREFSNNLGILAESVKFLFYKERYFIDAPVSSTEMNPQTVQEISQTLSNDYKNAILKMGGVSDEMQRNPNEANRLRGLNEVKISSKKLQRQDDLDLEVYIFKCLCSMSKNMLRKIHESTQIYAMMYQLAETCLTSRFVRDSVIDEHRQLFSSIRGATEEKNSPNWLEYFMFLQQIYKECSDEVMFLEKLTDLVLELAPSEEVLFLDLYKDDLENNLEKIAGLINAFGLLKEVLTDTRELQEVEQDRQNLFKAVMPRLESLDQKQQPLSPRSRQMLLRQTYQAFSQALLDHEEMVKRVDRILTAMDRSMIKVSRIMSYRPYLESSHRQLLAARNTLNSRFEEKPEEKNRTLSFGQSTSPFNLVEPTQNSLAAQQQEPPMLSAFKAAAARAEIDNQIPDLPSNSINWRFPDDFDSEEAYLLDRTARLHEMAKERVEKNLDEQTRYDLSSLLVYTSIGKDVTWANLNDLDRKFALSFNKQMARSSMENVDFKESCLKIKRVLESHIDNCSRYDNSKVSGKIAKYHANRIDAERRLKFSLASLIALYSHCDKLEIEAKLSNRVFDYSNEQLFNGFNGLAIAFAELSNLVTECDSAAKSDYHKDFAMKFRKFVNEIISTSLKFVGFSELKELVSFVMAYRTLMDINNVHRSTFIELERAVMLNNQPKTFAEVDRQAQIYLAIREMRMRQAFQKCMEIQRPTLFTTIDRETLTTMERSMEDNCQVFTSILEFFREVDRIRQTGNDINDIKRRFAKKLLDDTQGVNPQMRRWVEEFVKNVLIIN